MNTTALRTNAAFGRHSPTSTTTATETVRSVARDFVAGLFAVTKAGLLSQQATRPRLRRL